MPTWEMPGSTVRRGSTGNDAKLVQKRLKELGYYTKAIDSEYGSGMVTAVKNFQKKKDMMVIFS